MRINILSCDNGVGLSRDVKIITDLLIQNGHAVSFSAISAAPAPAQVYDLNIFLEIINHKWLNVAKKNVLIPNPEWYDNGWVQYLPRFDMVCAKTKCAEDMFRRRGVPTIYTSFTSPDRYMDTVQKNDMKFFHLAGKSMQKGTEMLLRTWEKNASFPPLTVVQDPGKWRRRVSTKNVSHIYDHLDEFVLKTLQNSYGVHICPSETEGFGHYIMEALSCRAIVLTTNAPPMNEIITTDRGIYIEHMRKATQRLATTYFVIESTIERSVRLVMAMNNNEKNRLRDNGRKFFEENDAFFRRVFVETINGVL